MNKGLFPVLRTTHPYQVGNIVNGKHVTSTYYTRGTKDNILGDPWIVLDYKEKIAVSEIRKGKVNE